MSRVQTFASIGQESEEHVALVSDTIPHRVDEDDLVLLADAGIGHADMPEIRSIPARSD
jgi:hypothetical protein